MPPTLVAGVRLVMVSMSEFILGVYVCKDKCMCAERCVRVVRVVISSEGKCGSFWLFIGSIDVAASLSETLSYL
jgi:hypothetical protein